MLSTVYISFCAMDTLFKQINLLQYGSRRSFETLAFWSGEEVVNLNMNSWGGK
jgi:hypothetical protein